MTFKMDIETTLKYFGELIDKRFENHGHELTTEDNIRYDFFYALTHCNNLKPWNILLEAPYPFEILNLQNKFEVDFMIKPTEQIKTGLICEFKYDRKANSTVNKTNRYGKLINDLLRLSLLKDFAPNYRNILVYVSDIEMIKYKNSFYINQTSEIDFQLTDIYISNLKPSARLQINSIFLNPFTENNITGNCKLIYNHIINDGNKSYGIYVWDVFSTRVII
jgi:hypothetical protein